MSTSVLFCTLPLHTNYQMMDILSFHISDASASSDSLEANQLRKGIVWHSSTAYLTPRFLLLFTEIVLSIGHTLASLAADESSTFVRMLGINQPIDIFEKSVGQHP